MTVRSDVDLPEVEALPDQFSPDVDVEVGPVVLDADQRDGGLYSVPDGAAFEIPDVARYAMLDGCRIRIDPAPGVDPRNVRLYLLGSAFGVLLHQRRSLPLHAGAVVREGRAYAFIGPSGAGKSTLCNWFVDQGLGLLTDDVCVVTPSPGDTFVAHSGPSRLRLWREALEASGRLPLNHERSFHGPGDDRDKFDVEAPRSAWPSEGVRLVAIYLLGDGAGVAIERVSTREAVETLVIHTYRGLLLGTAGDSTNHWQQCLALARDVPVFRYSRPQSLDRMGADGARLLLHMGSIV